MTLTLSLPPFFTPSYSVARIDPSLPLPPKGPPSSYALFFVDFVSRNKSHYLTSEGKVKTSELAKEAGKVWNDLGDAKKVSAGADRAERDRPSGSKGVGGDGTERFERSNGAGGEGEGEGSPTSGKAREERRGVGPSGVEGGGGRWRAEAEAVAEGGGGGEPAVDD